MLSNWLLVLAFAAFAVTFRDANANGSPSEFAAGGVVFREAADIAIAREDLYVSVDLVRVSYVYRSDAKDTQNVTIAFPMPPVPVDPGGPYPLAGFNEADPRNYMAFAVKVDGKQVVAKLHEYAYVGQEDVSELVKASGLSLFIPPAGSASDMIKALPANKLQSLCDRGIVSRGRVVRGVVQAWTPGSDDPPHYSPLWSYQSVYEWRQSFPPGPTTVEVSYRPLTGESDDCGSEPVREVAKYCIDEGVRSAIAKRRAAGQICAITTLGYILTTAQNWKGPIGEFNLIVDKSTKEEHIRSGVYDLVAFCPGGAKRTSATQFTWTAKGFTPERDLNVMFYDFFTWPPK